MMSGKTLAVALMAGGRSTRMGQDKACLKDREGRPLWQGRLMLLQELKADEVLISCREAQPYLAESGDRLVFDRWENAGPLGGIVSCLEAMQSDFLLVLAVDLPGMTKLGLETLLAAAMPQGFADSPSLPALYAGANGQDGMPKAPSFGAVFRNGGFLEPLVAVYPKWMAASGWRRLEDGQFSLQQWIGEAGAAIQIVDAPAEWAGLFANLNDPVSWERWIAEEG